jgi:hypothetical protein
MKDIRFDASDAQPPCQPEAVATGFEPNDHAGDLVAGFDGFITPAMQQLE